MKKRLKLAMTVLGAVIGALFLAAPTTALAIPAGLHDGGSQSPSQAVTTAIPTAPATVTVRAGDTLSGIGTSVGRSWIDLAGWNQLADPNMILIGQVLRVPPASYHARYDRPTAAAATVTAVTSAPRAAPQPVHATSVQPVGSADGLPWPWDCIAAGVGTHPRTTGESGGNPAENTGNGYYGAFQFAPQTWDTMMKQLGLGYQAYPYAAAAPLGIQLEAAEHLQAEAGWGQWPQTSRACGL